MYTVDLHTHTRFFHGFPGRPTPYDPLGARLLTAVARWRGLDGVAVTNHDYYTPLPTVRGITPLPGIEVSSSRGHILVVGPDPPRVTRVAGLDPPEVVELAHDRDCVAIIAHPYRSSSVREVDAEFDAVEINGKHPRTSEWVERLAVETDLPTVGGSDAHYPFEVGRAYTAIDAPELTPESVVAAIRDGRVEARVDDWLPHRLLRQCYRVVHTEQGKYDRPDWVTPGVGRPPGER